MNVKCSIIIFFPFSLFPGAFHLTGSCVSLMWFYGFWNNLADLRPSVATNAWSSSMTSYLSSQVSLQGWP